MMGLERQATYERLQTSGQEPIFAVQDSTALNFSGRRVVGLGVLENNQTSGFFAHTTLAVSAQGVPIGLLDQQVWSRRHNPNPKDEAHKSLPIQDKESYKWLQSVKNSLKTESKCPIITICDREGDIFELFQLADDEDVHFIVRAVRNRRLEEGGKLYEVLEQTEVAEYFTLAIPRRPQEKAHSVTMALRYATVTLLPPKSRAKGDDFMPLTPQTIQVIEAVEVNPPADKTPIGWILLTDLQVQSPDDARRILLYYSYRWLVERFHFVLKSGLGIEDSQLESLHALHNWLGLCSSVAWRLLWMTYQARITPEASCEQIFEPDEWQALAVYMTKNPHLPSKPPTLYQMTCWIAQLGGFIGRKSDGEPGVKVLWRGLIRLQDIVDTWRIFQQPPTYG
jgi:hypothetical protein